MPGGGPSWFVNCNWPPFICHLRLLMLLRRWKLLLWCPRHDLLLLLCDGLLLLLLAGEVGAVASNIPSLSTLVARARVLLTTASAAASTAASASAASAPLAVVRHLMARHGLHLVWRGILPRLVVVHLPLPLLLLLLLLLRLLLLLGAAATAASAATLTLAAGALELRM
jgi:hypothetical protein